MGVCMTLSVMAQDDVRQVYNFDALRAVPVGTDVRLTLMYDTVLCVVNEDIYLRGDCGVACMTGMGFKLEAGTVLLGSVTGRRGEANGILQLVATEKTTDEYVIESEHNVFTTPLYNALEWDAMYQSMKDNVGEVVEVSDVTVDSVEIEAGKRRLCLRGSSGEQQIVVNDFYNVCRAPMSVPFVCKSAKIVVASSGNAVEACPLYTLRPEGWSAINDITTSSTNDKEIYDLSGRRLSSEPTRGMYIRNGKKVMVR